MVEMIQKTGTECAEYNLLNAIFGDDDYKNCEKVREYLVKRFKNRNIEQIKEKYNLTNVEFGALKRQASKNLFKNLQYKIDRNKYSMGGYDGLKFWWACELKYQGRNMRVSKRITRMNLI
jgi:hypothetical protein